MTATHMQMSGEFIQEAVEKAGKTQFVKGFVSISGIDRHGDDITADKFDVKSFMRNPQLWLNHHLLQKKTDDGVELEVSVGVVRSADIAKVSRKDDSGKATVLSVETGDTLAAIDKETADTFGLADGDTGLWAVAEAHEPEVIKQIRDRHLNAFSWQGVIYRDVNHKITKIDLYEVSLVNVPANARAVFMLGKELLVSDNTLFLITQDKQVFPVNSKAELKTKESYGGVPYMIVTLADSGTHTVCMVHESSADSVEDIAVCAEVLLKDSSVVAVLKNTWEATEDGCGIYERVSLYTRDSATNAGSTIVDKAVWSTAYINDLPDSSFAYVEPGGKKDNEGKTTPRSLRHFPYKNHNGKLDEAHVRNALSQIPKSKFGKKALPKILAACRELGIKTEYDNKALCDALLDSSTELSVIEKKALLAEHDSDEINHSATETEKHEGGDNIMDPEQLKKLLEETLKPVSDSVAAITARLDALETSEKAEESKADEGAKAESQEAKAEDETSNDDSLKALAELVGTALKPIADSVKQMTDRLDAVEKRNTPRTRTSLKTDDAENKEEDAGSGGDKTLLPFAVAKRALNSMSPEARNRAIRNSLAVSLLPDMGQYGDGDDAED